MEQQAGRHDSKQPPPRILNPSYPSFSSSAANPPAQQPPFDPFQRRDPFMPSSSPSKRHPPESHRLSDGAQRVPDPPPHDTLQPAPPPPPSPFHTGPIKSFSEDRNRRSPLGGGGFAGPPLDHRPAPSSSSSFLTRQMPPPLASPQQSSLSQYSKTSLASPQAASGARENNGAGVQRSSGSMSIRALVDGPKSEAWSPFHSRSHASYMTSSPAREYSAVPKEQGYPRTPEERAEERAEAVPGPSEHPFAASRSPRNEPNNFSRLFQPFHSSNSSSANLPPRPFSQPVGFESSDKTAGSDPSTGVGTTSNGHGYKLESAPDSRDRALSDLEGKRYAPLGDGFRPQHPSFLSYDHANGKVGPPRNAYSPSAAEMGTSVDDGASRSQLQNDVSTKFGPVGIPPDPKLHRETFPDRQPFNPYSEDAGHAQLPNDPRLPGDFRTKHVAIDPRLRRSIEGAESHHRYFLGINSEGGRRSSPLPQAVQGAQGQPVGSARDPSIKSEFGRMFSGLGSGVGSTPQPLVPAPIPPPSSSTRQSPAPENGIRENDSTPASAPRNDKRRKRTAEEDFRAESDSGDGLVTPTGGAPRGNKARHNHPGIPHHHHPHSHHHHHHHHRKTDEEPPQSRRASNTPLSTLKFGTALPNQPNSTLPHHHHHHHTQHHHHHHHVPAKAQPYRRPITTIKTQPLLQSISHLPRQHLGSRLYTTHVRAPAPSATMIDSKHMFTSSPIPLPRLEGKENCTITIRVPRSYLKRGSREEICKARNVWGTDVYTDDSDPLCAAVHAGWIRGVWPDDVDAAVLDSPGNGAQAGSAGDAEAGQPSPSTGKKEPAEATLTSPPAAPVEPPPDRDLHLTLLVMPPLEMYSPSVWHGVKSRGWGGNHDGMSFKVEKVEWVDEGKGGRFEERGSEARRKRLKAALAGMRGARNGLSATAAAAAAAVNGAVAKANGLPAEDGEGGKVVQAAAAA